MPHFRLLAAVLAFGTALPLLGGATPASATFTPGTLHARSLVFDGVERVYDVWVPASYDGSTAVPLVLDLHGYGSNKTAQRGVSGFQAQADLHNFLVAWPQGTFGLPENPEGRNMPDGPSWNAGGFCCGAAASTRVDDVGFLNAVARAIEAEANIDLRRVYSTGISNGGAMSHYLACESANSIAAVAPVAFPLNVNPLDDCRPLRPIAVRHYAGTTDTLVKYEGVGSLIAPAQTSFAYWRDVTGCAGTTPDETTTIGTSTCERYTNCEAGTEIGLCSVNASVNTPIPGHITYINPDLNIAADAWDFFTRQQAPAPVCGDGVLGVGEECDDGNTGGGDGCDAACALEPCTPAPAEGCRSTTYVGSRLRIRDDIDDANDSFQWKWSKGQATELADFGNPTDDQALWMCVYSGGVLKAATAIPPGGDCGGAPCWSASRSGFAYADESGSAGGITAVSMRAGATGKARVQWKGEGPGLAMPGELSGPVVVQMKKAAGGACWQSTFTEPFKQNANGVFSDSGF